MFVGIDPGKNLGVAFVDEDGRLKQAEITELNKLRTMEFGAAKIIVGDGTGSAEVQKVLLGRGLEFVVVDETATSIEARRLYFWANPPRGLLRLLPPGLRWPPRPVDDYAAYAIVLRYQKKKPG